MNPVILNLAVPAAVTAPAATGTGGARDAALDNNAFSALLAVKLNVALAARVPAGAAAAAADPALAALEAKIAKMTKAGMSSADIVATLAAQLATAVARGLGTTNADAPAQLEAVIREALAPPGDNSVERSTADRTQTLAQRFLQLQTLATDIVGGRQPGQQNDIAGTFLDAAKAKEHPAPASATQQNPRPEAQPAAAATARTATPSPAAGAPALAYAAARGGAVRPRPNGPGHGHASELDGSSVASGDAVNLGHALAATGASVAAAGMPLAPRPPTAGAQPAPRGGPQAASRSTTQGVISKPQGATGRAPQAATTGAAQTAAGSALQASTSGASAAAIGEAALGSGGLSQIDAAGDGRTVKLVDRRAVATGGDTVLGRVLTRAAIAADTRQTQVVAREPKALASSTPSGQAAVGPAIGSKGASVSASGGLPAAGTPKAVQAAVAITVPPQGHTWAGTRSLQLGDVVATPAVNGKEAAGDVVAPTGADRAAGKRLPGGGDAAASGPTSIAVAATGKSPDTNDVDRAAGTALPGGGGAVANGSVTIAPDVAATGKSPDTNNVDRAAGNTLRGVDATAAGSTPIAGTMPATGDSPVPGQLLSNGPGENREIGQAIQGAPTQNDIASTSTSISTSSTSKALGLGAAVATDAAAAVVGGVAVAGTGLGDAAATGVPTPPPIGGNGNTADTVVASLPAMTGKPPDPAVAAFVKSFAAAVRALGSVARVESAADASHAPGSLPLGPPDASGAAAFLPAVAPFTIQHIAPAAAPAPPHQPPTDQSSIVDQVLRGAFLHTTGASSEMRISLVPESLGDVNIKLVVTAGTVSAHVVAQTPEVRDALVAAQPQLTKSLADAGLKLASYTVDLSGSGFTGFSRQQQDSSQNSNRAPRTTGLRDDDSDDASLDAVPSFGPSIVSAARTGDYNYLA